MKINEIAEQLQNAELVLVGLGEELDMARKLGTSQEYQKWIEKTENKEIVPWLNRYFLDHCQMEGQEIFADLSKILKGRNYFIISLCQDGLIMDADLKADRLVQPCGNYTRLQCADKCSSQLYDISQDTVKQMEAYVAGDCGEKEITLPICPHCGARLVFNNKDAENYVEEGYLKQWEGYRKWLQGTVNKRVCILELGVGMKYPSVIRWPFEKVTFFNQKASFFRVHERLYQIAEEIKDRAYGICMKPNVFLKELSNALDYDKL